MAGKLISDLNSVGTLGLADQMEIDKDVSGVRTSYKTSVKDIVDFANHNVAEEYDSTSSYAVGDYCIYESVLYKCTASTTGSFDSTKWTSVVVTDEMGSGGGGTGGHTIIDENGNSMTARSGLQFTGDVVVTDDSANNKTIVSVLSGGGHNYSTTEHIVGTWRGETLWEKTYVANSEISISTGNQGNDITSLIDNLSSMAQVVNCFATNEIANGFMPLVADNSGGKFVVYTFIGNSFKTLTVQYTKSA